MWCWRRLLRVQPVQPGCSLEGLKLELKKDAKAETPILWPPHVKSWLTGKDSDAERDWGQEEKGMTEDEMAGMQFMGSQRVGHNWATELNWTPALQADSLLSELPRKTFITY